MDNFNKHKLRQFDAFPKVDDEVIRPTTTGTISTLIVVVISAFLFLSELKFQFINNNQLLTEFIIEPYPKNQIMFNFDIRVAMKCSELNFNFSQSLKISDLNYNNVVDFIDVTPEEAFKDGLQHLNNLDGPSSADVCKLTASLPIQKRSGEVVISPKGHGQGGKHVSHKEFDFTHYIKKLSFGTETPNIKSLLDNEMKIAKTNMDVYRYYLTIIPTIYVDINNKAVVTNQYSVLHSHELSDMQSSPPGIHFMYEIEPIVIRYTEFKQPYSKFLVHLCSIISGLWVVSMFVNQCVLKATGYF